MHTALTWLDEHRWTALALFVAAACLYLVSVHLVPDVLRAVERYRTWRAQVERIEALARGGVEHRHIEAQVHRLQERFDALYVSLPRSDHMSTLLQVLQASADGEGIRLYEIRPGARTAFARYAEVPVDVEVSGAYHAFGTFVRRIEQSPHVIKVRRASLRRGPADAFVLDGSLTLSVIVLKERGGAK